MRKLLAALPDSGDELVQTVNEVLPGLVPWTIDVARVPESCRFMVTPEQGVVLRLFPAEDHVGVLLDPGLQPQEREDMLYHALGHLLLMHIRPGDNWGHWDTLGTATSDEPHRAWDRDALKAIQEVLPGPNRRRVESLDQCNVKERAQLGLWRMMGEVIGETQALHPAASRYQKAAYQRQAAQRLVGMLDKFSGAMLCDGVGLGKTYVATTVMLHYANWWRERRSSAPERLTIDPFRVTILAPNSVVTTWQREAVPGLIPFGLSEGCVRVISHSKMSRISPSSELLQAGPSGLSDLEFMLFSDLVIVDEAHNFRSFAARRTKVLRDLMRLQPRRDARRMVLLLTATPINNSLEDLRQELSLFLSKPIWVAESRDPEAYRAETQRMIVERCRRARTFVTKGDVAAYIVHGTVESKFSEAIEFRGDLALSSDVVNLAEYLKEQDAILAEYQERQREYARSGQGDPPPREQIRIAEVVLDKLVVQRSRALCKEIESHETSEIPLLFRPDAAPPEQLRYSDEYDGISDVLARFLPLFDEVVPPTGTGIDDMECLDPNDAGPTEVLQRGLPEGKGAGAGNSLSLKVYMWYDVKMGFRRADEMSSVVGLQRVLLLKRLESSPVSFLITMLRLLVFHAYRLGQLRDLCKVMKAKERLSEFDRILGAQLANVPADSLDKLLTLVAGVVPNAPLSRSGHIEFLDVLSSAYRTQRPAAEGEESLPLPMTLLPDEETVSLGQEAISRLWDLKEYLLRDFDILLNVVPGLADIVLNRFERANWPTRFISGGGEIDWPQAPAWGMRLVTDAKLRQLAGRLLQARKDGQKVIVFSQFSDTVHYIHSVLLAVARMPEPALMQLLAALPASNGVGPDELEQLIRVTRTVTGATDERDEVIDSFCPYYRIGPHRPNITDSEGSNAVSAWSDAWVRAAERPVDVLLATDVLAEGVNLQDTALLINYDVHWNPVRMIQRSGRVDRRLNPRIEKPREFPELRALLEIRGLKVPAYYWHSHPNQSPVTVNMILPDQLEEALLLRERLAIKTMAIDFTLGLEQGTGAEADWMREYRYNGIRSLNSLEGDRAIERLASHHERLRRLFDAMGIDPQWTSKVNGWFRLGDADEESPLVARIEVKSSLGELLTHTRRLRPVAKDGEICFLRGDQVISENPTNALLVLDARTSPPRTLPAEGLGAHYAGPVLPQDLLAAAGALELLDAKELPMRLYGARVQQGISAIAANKHKGVLDHKLFRLMQFFLLQWGEEGGERAN